MKTIIAFVALGVIGIFALLYLRQRKCGSVQANSHYGPDTYNRPGAFTTFICGSGPPIRPNTAETNPNYAQPSLTKRLCGMTLGAATSVGATSTDPRIQGAAAYTAANSQDACSLVADGVTAVQDIGKGIKSLFGGVF